MLTFESTHEYYIGPKPSIFYCADHSSLIVTEDHENRLVISGIDKELVGKVSSEIKMLKPVEPYKGKGIKERGQYVLRKEGKKK